jgi:aminoglycoside/choline kinase family phosphotransferase
MKMAKPPPRIPFDEADLPDQEEIEAKRDPRFEGIFDPNSPRLRLIAGDASDRKFYRYREGDSTFICMQFPTWSGGYGGDPLSWLGMHRVLMDWRLPLPEVVHVDKANACIWTTDLGDGFLNRDLGSLPFDAARPDHQKVYDLYKEALALLVRAQYPDHSPELNHPARQRFFDSEKLLFELNFFGEHFVHGLLNLKVDAALTDEWRELASGIAQCEQVLCHRDYHARNLMVSEGRVFWIDFQDARMGPHSYDVVSLLRDSYVRFEASTREQLFIDYFDAMNNARLARDKEPFSAAQFFRERLLVGLQRNIKALGSFAYLHRIKRKKVYLSFVRHTLEVILAESHASELTVRFPLTFAMLESLFSGELGESFLEFTRQENIDQF